MKHVWTILCQDSSIDIETNLLSLFNCLEELNLVLDKTKILENNTLVIPVDLQMVNFWLIQNPAQDNILEIKVELIDPDSKSINQFENKFNVKKGILRFRNRTKIQGLPVTKEGRYIFRVMQRDEKSKEYIIVSELPLDIKISYKLETTQKPIST